MEAVATETATPATTTETTTAAPATQETSTSSSTGQRPTSMRAAFGQVAAAQTTPTQTTETAATVPPVEQTPDGAMNPKAGEPPQEKWPQILENARKKERESVEKELGWARSFKQEDLQEWAGYASHMSRDPVGFLQWYQSQLEAHPTYGQQLRSHAARTLAAGRGAAQPVDLTPDLVVDAGDGRQISTFSADRVQQIVQHAVQQAIAKEVHPLKEESQQRRAAQEAADYKQRLDAETDATMVEVNDILGITDVKSEDANRLFAALNQLMEQDKSLTAERAARRIYKSHVQPGLDAKADAKALDKLKQKAAGNTASGTTAAVTPKKPTNRAELAAYMRSLDRG